MKKNKYSIILIINIILLIIYSILYSIKNYHDPLSITVAVLLITYSFGSIIYKSNPVYTRKNIILSVIGALIITLFGINSFNFSYKTKLIELQNNSYIPITIDGILKDGIITKTHQHYDKEADFIDDASLSTEYQRYNKIDKSYKMTRQQKKVYYIPIESCKNIQIKFQRSTVDVDVTIDGKRYTITSRKSYYGKVKKIKDLTLKYNYNNIKIKYDIETILLLLLSLIINFNIVIRCINNKNNIFKLFLTLIVEFNQFLKLSVLSKMFIVFGSNIMYSKYYDEKKKIPKTSQIIISLIIAFTFIGGRFLNDSITLKLLIMFFIITIVIYYLINAIFNFIDISVKKVTTPNIKKKNLIIHRVLLFILILMICFIYGMIFNPYISHVDFEMEHLDLIENTYSNWHPYFHMLILKLFYTIFKCFKAFIYFRYIIYSLLLNTIAFHFYKKGLSLKKIYILSIIFTIFPVTGIMLTTPFKDTDFAIALIALTYYMYLITNDFKYFNSSIINYLMFILSLICTCLFRHNGLYIFAIISAVLYIISLKKKKRLLFLSIVLSIIIVFIIEVPLFRYLNVKEKPRNFDIVPVVHGLAYLIADNKNIDKKTYEYMTKTIYSKENFIDGYDKYNSDLLLYYINNGFKNKKINKKLIISMYAKQLLKTPISLIKARLWTTDMLWNVAEKEDLKTSKYQILYDEYENKYIPYPEKYKYNKTGVKIVNNTLVSISNNDLLNTIVFRSGIYLDIILILSYYCFVKRKRQIFAMAPVFINILTLVLAMPNQVYRYVWVFVPATIVYWLMIKYGGVESKKI